MSKKSIFAQQIQGFRVYQPCEFGTGNSTRELTIAVLLDDKLSARCYLDIYRASFNMLFRYNYAENRWWQRCSFEVRTDIPEIAALAAKFYGEFVAFCGHDDQTPTKFVEFAASKKVKQVWYEATVGRIFSDPTVKSFRWSYNGQEHYGNVLAHDQKQAMKKIRKSYPSGYIVLTEQPVDLREYDRFDPNWINWL